MSTFLCCPSSIFSAAKSVDKSFFHWISQSINRLINHSSICMALEAYDDGVVLTTQSLKKNLYPLSSPPRPLSSLLPDRLEEGSQRGLRANSTSLLCELLKPIFSSLLPTRVEEESQQGLRANGSSYHSHLIYPLTARVVGEPQMISQPVSSILPCSPRPSGTWRTPGLFIP